MIDIQLIKESVPDESALCELIETDLFGVVIDECLSEDQISLVIEAMYYYSHRCGGGKSRTFFIGKNYDNEYINLLSKAHRLDKMIEFVPVSDTKRLLTAFLGACAFVTNDADSNGTTLAKEFYLPRICLSDRKTKLENGILYISNTSEELGAALLTVKERNYSNELSGYKRLV